jgi:hypothetical protein
MGLENHQGAPVGTAAQAAPPLLVSRSPMGANGGPLAEIAASSMRSHSPGRRSWSSLRIDQGHGLCQPDAQKGRSSSH